VGMTPRDYRTMASAPVEKEDRTTTVSSAKP